MLLPKSQKLVERATPLLHIILQITSVSWLDKFISRMSGFAQRGNEATSDWLRRLVAEGAPGEVLNAVRAILETEKSGKELFSAMYGDG